MGTHSWAESARGSQSIIKSAYVPLEVSKTPAFMWTSSISAEWALRLLDWIKFLALLGTTYARESAPICLLWAAAVGRTDWTAIALDMMGQRLATMVRLDIVPPQAELDAEVESALSVLVEVFMRKGQTALDCLRRDSMANVFAGGDGSRDA